MIQQNTYLKSWLAYSFLFLTALIVFLALFLSISYEPKSANDISRLGGIIAVTRYSKLNFDDTVQKLTSDKACYKGKCYSSKPPSLNVAVGGILKVFYFIKPSILENDIAIYRLSTLLIVVLPLLGIFILFQFTISTASQYLRVFYSIYLTFFTLLFVYSRHLNNHVLEAFIQLLIFYVLFIEKKLPHFYRNILLGVLLSLLFAIDITYGAVVSAITFPFLIVTKELKVSSVWRLGSLKDLITIALAMLPILLLHFTLNYMQFETVLPPQLFPYKYLVYDGSRWVGVKYGMEKLNEPVLVRVFNYTIGTYGFFLYQPLLLLAFFCKKNYKDKSFIYVLLIVVSYILFNAIMQPNYGGSSFGPRRFLPLIPLLYYFVVKNIKRQNEVLLVLLFIVNGLISVIGATNPWENWNYYNYYKDDPTAPEFYFPLLFTLRKLLLRIF